MTMGTLHFLALSALTCLTCLTCLTLAAPLPSPKNCYTTPKPTTQPPTTAYPTTLAPKTVTSTTTTLPETSTSSTGPTSTGPTSSTSTGSTSSTSTRPTSTTSTGPTSSTSKGPTSSTSTGPTSSTSTGPTSITSTGPPSSTSTTTTRPPTTTTTTQPPTTTTRPPSTASTLVASATLPAATGAAVRAALPAALRPAAVARYADWGRNFKETFADGVDEGLFNFADGYRNWQPFNTRWRRRNHHLANGVLNLDVKKEHFKDSGSASGGYAEYPYTSGELRSREFYGVGCFATCMKPSAVSGVSSSFYSHSGEHDVPPGFQGGNPKQLEVDIEFVGKDTTVMQSNFFNRMKIPGANSGSGVEEMHDLGFDAAADFHVYGFRWTHGGIEWHVDGRKVRTVYSSEHNVPNPDYAPMRIVANAWPVNRQAEEWAGPLDQSFSHTSSRYRWIRFQGGADCNIPVSC